MDRTTITNWQIQDGNARWDMPGQWLTTYSWTVPQTIAAGGGALSLRVSAEERTGRANTRICPSLGATAGFAFKGQLAQPVSVAFCAEAVVKPTDTQSKALTLLPPSSAAPGSLLYLTIGAQDGPVYTYTYRAGAAATPRSCPALPRILASTRQKAECRYSVRWSLHQVRHPSRADGSLHRTAGRGRFQFVVEQGESLTGRHCGEGPVNVVHVHEQITDEDSVIRVKGTARTCVRIPSSRPVKALAAGFVDGVELSNDRDCGKSQPVNVALRAGEPFNLLSFVCYESPHVHRYRPRGKPGSDGETIVNVTINISPA